MKWSMSSWYVTETKSQSPLVGKGDRSDWCSAGLHCSPCVPVDCSVSVLKSWKAVSWKSRRFHKLYETGDFLNPWHQNSLTSLKIAWYSLIFRGFFTHCHALTTYSKRSCTDTCRCNRSGLCLSNSLLLAVFEEAKTLKPSKRVERRTSKRTKRCQKSEIDSSTHRPRNHRPRNHRKRRGTGLASAFCVWSSDFGVSLFLFFFFKETRKKTREKIWRVSVFQFLVNLVFELFEVTLPPLITSYYLTGQGADTKKTQTKNHKGNRSKSCLIALLPYCLSTNKQDYHSIIQDVTKST